MNMKKGFIPAALAAILLLQGNTPPASSAASDQAAAPKQQILLPFYWYNDPDFYSYTGEYSAIDQELTRLRNLYSGYTFSAAGGPGLIAWEWGYNPGTTTAVIYSNYY